MEVSACGPTNLAALKAFEVLETQCTVTNSNVADSNQGSLFFSISSVLFAFSDHFCLPLPSSFPLLRPAGSMRERPSPSSESESLASTPRLPVSVAGVKRQRSTDLARTGTTLASRPRPADDEDDDEPEEPRLQRRRRTGTSSSTTSPPNDDVSQQRRLNGMLVLPGDIMVIRDFEVDRLPFPLLVMLNGIYATKTSSHQAFYEVHLALS